MHKYARLTWIAGLLALVAALVPVRAAENTPLEYAVKANFLYKFGDYIAWPDSVFSTPEAPVVLCVAGPDPFGRVLDDAVEGENIGGRPIAVMRLDRVTGKDACHILYVSDSRTQSAAAALQAIAGRPVLTITDNASGNSVGIINFMLRDNRVRFAINQQRAADNHIDISSKLLSLAVAVLRAQESRP